MTWYRYYQNNSYGENHIDPHSGIGKVVLLEAESPAEADARAQEIGVYFDPYFAIDCSCCGTRWSEQSHGYGLTEGYDYYTEVPEYIEPFYSPGYAHPREGGFFEIPVRAD